MNYWKRHISNCFDVLNPNIKLCLLLVEWKIIKHKTICVFVMWTIILLLAVKLVGNKFLVCESIWITGMEWLLIVLMCWIQISNNVCSWLSGRSSNINNMCFWYVNHHFVTAVLSLLINCLDISFWCVGAY